MFVLHLSHKWRNNKMVVLYAWRESHHHMTRYTLSSSIPCRGGRDWGGDPGEVFGISPGRPIATGRGGFVYFPNSSQRTWVGRPRGEGSEAARAGAGTHPVSHRLGLFRGNVAGRLSWSGEVCEVFVEQTVFIEPLQTYSSAELASR